MPKKYNKYWYLDELAVAGSGLFNLRGNDLRVGGNIRRGEIVSGQCGIAVAEADVPNFSGRILTYHPNRCVEWQECFLTCMTLDDLPAGNSLRKAGKSSLRHKHYVVAELTDSKAIDLAKKIGARVVRSADDRTLLNLEIFTVPGRTPVYRRAKLL